MSSLQNLSTNAKHGLYGTSAFNMAGEAIMSFAPINAIHQHLCAFHYYAHDRTRQIEVRITCSVYVSNKLSVNRHITSAITGPKIYSAQSRINKKFLIIHALRSQCVIYDSDEPNARLIGIEYIISENVFKTLNEQEKRYWHSHKYEVCGMIPLSEISTKRW
jgi:hypothetical protein